ncbi:RHS repeat-associated core domain-containing protein [Dokdonella sp.]|uniref:RHS repeat-associated core domain-containing protein n=1 Tax=Dokdonella sp. TaxID=2291710 RepID=UPI0035285062
MTYAFEVKACSGSGAALACSPYRGTALVCLKKDGPLPGPYAPNSSETRSYDAFGKPKWQFLDRADGTLDLLPDTVRGFTNHRHLDDVRLIHMNGRVYDYQLGRFLSVDPMIQFPTNTQSMNPYSYIMNNPLSGVDPSGYQLEEIKEGESTTINMHDNRSANPFSGRVVVSNNGGGKISISAVSGMLVPGSVLASLSSGAVGQGATGAGGRSNQNASADQKGSVANLPNGAATEYSSSMSNRAAHAQEIDLEATASSYGLEFTDINFIGVEGSYSSSKLNVYVNPESGSIVQVIGPAQEAGSGIVRGALALGRAAGIFASRGSKLSRAMVASGMMRSVGVHAHHIVAQGAKIAAPARAVLTRFGINVHEASNGAFLLASQHAGLHTTRYYKAVNNILSQATTRQEALQMLAAIRQGLQAGTFP